MNHELPDVQTGFRKGRGTRDEIANICWIMEKVREFQGPVTFGDIPFYFSREEWGSLDPAQRDLFWDIKRENSRNVALGKHWAQPGLWVGSQT